MNWIKEKIGISWLILIALGSGAISLGLSVSNSWWMIFLFPAFVFVGIISVLFVEWIRPDVVITNGGFFGLLWARLFWNFGAQIGTMFILGPFVLAIVLGPFLPNSLDLAKSEFEKFCNQEQIVKTGVKKCENAKKNLKTELNKTLNPLKESFKVLKNSIRKLEQNKELKCSKKGIKDFGVQGCETAKQKLSAEQSKVSDLDKRIKELQKEISDLVKK